MTIRTPLLPLLFGGSLFGCQIENKPGSIPKDSSDEVGETAEETGETPCVPTDEVCDGVDNDCDGEADEGATDMGTWHEDADEDSFGAAPVSACEQPAGTVENADDCDDANPAVYPGAPEICNEIDDDCDALVDADDEDLEGYWVRYPDLDEDGQGDPLAEYRTCDPNSGVDNADDCDDTNADVYLDAPEICNEIDDDCDELIDVDDEDLEDGLLLYEDADGDGYGDPEAVLWTCDPDAGVTNADDCDDDDIDVSPEASEICNEIDDDCDGAVDSDDCECGGEALEGLNIVITDSTLEASGYTMSTQWTSVATSMGFSVSVVSLSTLATASSLDDADVLVVSSGVSTGLSSTITANILSFIESGGSVYLQTEYSCTYATNLAFASILGDLGASFSWVGTVSGDIGTSIVASGCLAELPDTFTGFDYYWYACQGTGIPGFLTYGSKDVAFQYCPDDPDMGQIITTTDQDWVRTSSGADLVLMANILNALATNPNSCP